MNTIMRPAVAMIELIFALVIMAIAMFSAPMLIDTATKSGFVAIQQESINEAATKINMILGYHWDENSADELFLDPILGVATVNADLDPVAPDNTRRAGTPNESYRSFIRADAATLNASAFATFGNADAAEAIEDDMDDFNGASGLLQVEASGNDYVENAAQVAMTTAIAYNADAVAGGYNQATIAFNPFVPNAGTSNIKSITTTLTSVAAASATELDKTIILRAFSCNIGGYKLEERDF